MTRVALEVREAAPNCRSGCRCSRAATARRWRWRWRPGRVHPVREFVFAHVADEGLARAAAGPLLRYRRQIGADHIAVFADIKKKHASHAMTADVSIAEAARAAEFFGADGVIVTGAATGKPVEPADVRIRGRGSNCPCSSARA